MTDADFRLSPAVAEALQARVPQVAERVLAAIVNEVPLYADPFRGGMGANIERAIRVALDGFLALAARSPQMRRHPEQERVHDAAYALGQGEARAGRPIDALTSAYGVGARAAWRDLGAGAIEAGLSSTEVARLAELVFAFINDISVRSINGHADELASRGQVRQRRLERLCLKLLEGAPEEELHAAADLADWTPPRMLCAVLLGQEDADALLGVLDPGTLRPGEDPPGVEPGRTVLLVPVSRPPARGALMGAVTGRSAVVGPALAWTAVRGSYLRVLRCDQLGISAGPDPVDSEAHLLELVLGADAEARADLRARALTPLEGLSAAAREKLTATLRAWLLHQGRRDDIARALFVHPQTVRYRMGQLRDLYGDALDDPRHVLELTVALA
ncbi:MAG TPA: helix-turn-helix domain-containing protein [Solirubrobacteraceae bacterium]|nr:helix-turn-helix domain-containing protein [Solirubrobacteraceae bacterium]